MKSVQWIFVPILVVAASLTLLYPNFAERELELAVRKEFKQLPEETRKDLLSSFAERWKTDYNPKGDWQIEPDPGVFPEQDYYLVKGRFITSAKINQLSQENQELILEPKNKLRPTWVEEYIFGGRPLAIRLGLDLQGGMRVVLKGDFDDYTSKLKDSYTKEIEELTRKKSDASLSEKERKEATDKLKEIDSYFELTPSRKLAELEKAKLIIDNRLTNQNLTEPQVRIQKDQDSIEVSLPGVSNSSQILDIIRNTETVEYRLREPSDPNNQNSRGTYHDAIELEEMKLMNQGKREETEIVKFQNIVKQKLGKDEQDKFLEAMEKKYNIPEKYKLYVKWSRANNPKASLLPREFVVLERAISLDGKDMRNARESYDQNRLTYYVSFSLTSQGAEKFFDITSKNVGRQLAIVWGDKVISDPVIRSPIAGGNAQIDGEFGQKEATDLANVISEGALPIPLNVLEMRFIGPTLGIESIEVGLKAVLLGFALVIVFMLVIYRLSGLVADIALLVNVIVLMALLSLMGFTLTLPGFAGIILTVGMAVDANVIIYERIKEELVAGKHVSAAVAQGFENAFWTIMDSNVTTLISGILMIKLGNGPIKGFAITLCWGIITSLFTSLFLSRMIMDLLVNKLGVRKLQIGFKKLESKNV
ncbi:protein translocase subunit SecD [Leptospira licerasiae]|uniref:Protein translocase subunit SecD n=1 Tax=Leptospira licerasiae str. MMD4847 TaxID=1049971 RepID=A0ABN0H8H8_9LEPT|nr:protein translocase subunit SecD [Leptospira licerasiae]EIE00203.1 export membrane protein SecD [Leptospira licerasiae serovar Varillal str. VAR 010]EJZ41947.1 export membrane protein SecD [Leptospira licerasiae str. MMD4847]